LYGHQGAHFKMSAVAGSFWRRKDSRSTDWEFQCAGAAAGKFPRRIPKPGRHREGVTQSLSITQNNAGAGRRRTARRKNPPGKSPPKGSHINVK
jgi:hypothetical protein